MLFLFRQNMRELDDITTKLKQKLVVHNQAPPPLPSQPISSYGGLGVAATSRSPDLPLPYGLLAHSAGISEPLNVVQTHMSDLQHIPPSTAASAVAPTVNTGLLHQQKPETELSMYSQTLYDARRLLQRLNNVSSTTTAAAVTPASLPTSLMTSVPLSQGYSSSLGSGSHHYDAVPASILSTNHRLPLSTTASVPTSSHVTATYVPSVMATETRRAADDAPDMTGHETSVWDEAAVDVDSDWEAGRMGDDGTYGGHDDLYNEIDVDGDMGELLQTTVLTPRPLNNISSYGFENFTAFPSARSSERETHFGSKASGHVESLSTSVERPTSDRVRNVNNNSSVAVSSTGGSQVKVAGKREDDVNVESVEEDEEELLLHEDPTKRQRVSRQINKASLSDDEDKAEELLFEARSKLKYRRGSDSSSDDDKETRLANQRRRPRKPKAKVAEPQRSNVRMKANNDEDVATEESGDSDVDDVTASGAARLQIDNASDDEETGLARDVDPNRDPQGKSNSKTNNGNDNSKRSSSSSSSSDSESEVSSELVLERPTALVDGKRLTGDKTAPVGQTAVSSNATPVSVVLTQSADSLASSSGASALSARLPDNSDVKTTQVKTSALAASQPSTVPNFFLPPPAMEQAMRSLHTEALASSSTQVRTHELSLQ
jgi:hypothetical protein